VKMSPKTQDETVEKKAGSEEKSGKDAGTDKKAAEAAALAEEELSEEDRKLKEELELCVERLQEEATDVKVKANALASMRSLIRASTTSMTSVPKPLKFMIPHYDTMKQVHEKITDPAVKHQCADVVSVLSMTMSDKNECLKYKLIGDESAPMDDWGHEYIRHLSGEIVSEWNELTTEKEGEGEAAAAAADSTMEDAERKTQLMDLVKRIVPAQMKHHAEAEACDLLIEVERLDLLQEYVDKQAYNRVCRYLTSCVPYVPEPENTNLLHAALKLFRKFEEYPQALRLALQINDSNLVMEIFTQCPDPIVQKQLAFMLGHHHHYLELDENEYDDIIEIISNSHLNNHFLNLARELDIMEPKSPDDVYKSHLDNVRPVFGGGSNVDSARQNLASSFVNGFVNAGFGQDKLLMEDGQNWLFKNKDHGQMSATASIGLILLWDVDGGLTQIDKYLYSPETPIKAGALLACGIVNTGVRNDCDPALALLSDYVLADNNVMRVGAVLGLGLAYAGTNRQDLIQLLLPVFADEKSSMEVIGVTALACGLIAVGSCNDDVTTIILQTLMEKSDSSTDLKDPFAKFLPLGIGLCYLGKQEAAEATVAALEVLSDPFKSMAMTLVDICAYAGTGNVLKIQSLLHICSEHYDPSAAAAAESSKDESSSSKKDSKKKDDKKSDDSSSKKSEEAAAAAAADLSMQQAVAVLGLALVAMGEDIGSEMLFRSFGHLLRYCEPVIRRAVPLALGLISVSNPQLNILDTLSKFSHDSDAEVAHNAIFAMGLIGAGTNNARLAAMLRQLAQYYAKDSNNLFMVRIAQGLVHMGKGTLTLHPYHSDNQLMSPVAVAGLLGCLVAFLDVKQTILSKSHYLLYALSTAVQPRMLVTFDEELRPLPVSVRVGQAVDVVGQAGKPKTITGFQTHTTPVLLSQGERAELATEEYIPLTPIMEGFVILKKNPDY